MHLKSQCFHGRERGAGHHGAVDFAALSRGGRQRHCADVDGRRSVRLALRRCGLEESGAGQPRSHLDCEHVGSQRGTGPEVVGRELGARSRGSEEARAGSEELHRVACAFFPVGGGAKRLQAGRTQLHLLLGCRLAIGAEEHRAGSVAEQVALQLGAKLHVRPDVFQRVGSPLLQNGVHLHAVERQGHRQQFALKAPRTRTAQLRAQPPAATSAVCVRRVGGRNRTARSRTARPARARTTRSAAAPR